MSAEFLLPEEQESVELPNSGGARKSKLATDGDTIRFTYEHIQTTWDAVHNGKRLSENGKCLGWRSSKSSYSWMTYGEFIKRAENFGLGLTKIGLQPGQSLKAGIYAQNSVEWPIAQYGIWSQSAILIPLYDALGPDASTFMISQAEIEVVICDQEEKARRLLSGIKGTPSLKHIITIKAVSDELRNLSKENGIKLHNFNEIEELGDNAVFPLMYPQSSDIAMICYTSGTTGDPKGVILTHENLISTNSAISLFLGDAGPSKEDTSISYLPMAHVFEQHVQLFHFMCGGSIGFFSGDINQLVDDMRILKPTCLPAVPRLLNKFYEKAQVLAKSQLKKELCDDKSAVETALKLISKPFKEGLGGRISTIYSAAAPVYKNILEFYTKTLGCKVIEIYGQTESSGPCSVNFSDSDYADNVGPPLPCSVVKLVDVPEMECFSKNSTGEVCIRGPGVFKGYLKNPEKTAEVLDSDGWLHTGDIGMWLPNGTLKIIDRKKNFLKLSQGLYVAPEKIEGIYSLSPFVSQIFVHGDSLKSILVAVVVPEKEIILPWCDKNLKKYDSWNEICNEPLVRQLIYEDLMRVGKEGGLLSFEQVKCIHLHPEVLTTEGGFLTPTTKIKRDVWKKHFANELAALSHIV